MWIRFLSLENSGHNRRSYRAFVCLRLARQVGERLPFAPADLLSLDLLVDGVAQSDTPGQCRREKQRIVAESRETVGAEAASRCKPCEQDTIKPETLPLDRLPPQEMSASDSQVGHHSRDMGRTNDRIGIARSHRILEPTGHGRQEFARMEPLSEEMSSDKEQCGLDGQHDSITSADLQGALPEDEAADEGPEEKRCEYAKCLACQRILVCRGVQTNRRHDATHVTQRLPMDAEKTNCINAAGNHGKRASSDKYPQWYGFTVHRKNKTKAAVTHSLRGTCAAQTIH